jgi:hypothetical protein
MTVSRASLIPALAVCAALGLPAAAPALAQGISTQPLGAPVQLGPRNARPEAPTTPVPAPDAARAATAPPAAGLTPAPVQVQTLRAVDPDSVGVLDSSQGGFPIDLWQGMDKPGVARLLGLLPRRVASPAMRDLARRLLLSRVSAPAGDLAGESLLSRRVAVLFAMGDTRAALALLRNAPPNHNEDSLIRTEVEGFFLLNDNAGACRQVRAQVQERTDAYWQQAVAYCLALSGQPAKASLVADILAERTGDVPPAFFAAMDAIGGVKNAALDSLAKPTALHVSMLRAANLQIPADAEGTDSAALLRAVAVSPNAAFAMRLSAAERALAAGALTPETLREIYASAPADVAAAEKPLTYAEQSWGAAARALLTLSAAGQAVPTARAEALQRGFRLGLEKGGYMPFVMATLPQLLSLEPAGELSWFARDAGGALFAAGQIEQAQRWWDYVKAEAGRSDEARAAAQAMWPLAHLAGIAGDEDVTAARAAWWEAAKSGASAAAKARIQFALSEALGGTVAPALWRAVLGDAKPEPVYVPSPALRHALAAAAADKRLGEGVTLALIALGEKGPADAGLVALEDAIRALRALGLEKEARAVAVEAAVAGGL